MVSTVQHHAIDWNTNNDYDRSVFVDPVVVYQHFVRFLMEPSGGVSRFDTFIHTATPSRAVRTLLTQLYQPVAVNFTERYHTDWAPTVDRIQRQHDSPGLRKSTISRWLSVHVALGLVRAAEEARGSMYEKVYITRPDMLLWTPIDLRRYCDDAVYYSNCLPPYFPGRDDGCPSDFHYVMTSANARRFATMATGNNGAYLQQYRNTDNDFENMAMRDFVRDVVGTEFRTDHVVIARHEEVLRKTPDLHQEADYYRCHPRNS